jgi:hypothetical protein
LSDFAAFRQRRGGVILGLLPLRADRTFMSQSVKDLPDPLADAPAAQAASADDLIAQMADEAIDQLIADADRGAPPAASLVVDAPFPAGETVEPLDQPPAHEPAASATLADVFERAMADAESSEAGTLADEASPLAQPTYEPTPESNGILELDSASPDESRASDAAGNTVATQTEPASLSANDSHADVKALLAGDPSPNAVSGRPGVALWPLILLNAPFARLPASTRDVLGQVGIVTLVNAIAVLVYVLFLRR